jgi:hypothetical protein
MDGMNEPTPTTPPGIVVRSLIVPTAVLMPEFKDKLRTEEDEFSGLHTLLEPLRFWSKVLQAVVTVPAGFVTDYASVPRLPVVFLLVGGKGNRAAVVHDLLYTLGSTYPGTVTREQADAVLREAMLATGYARVTAEAFYRAVRWRGESHWHADNVDQPEHVTQAMADYAQGA